MVRVPLWVEFPHRIDGPAHGCPHRMDTPWLWVHEQGEGMGGEIQMRVSAANDPFPELSQPGAPCHQLFGLAGLKCCLDNDVDKRTFSVMETSGKDGKDTNLSGKEILCTPGLFPHPSQTSPSHTPYDN